MIANGTYQQPGRRHVNRVIDRDSDGRFIAKGTKPCTSRLNSFKEAQAKAVEMFEVMRRLTNTEPSKALKSREFPLPIYRAVIYDRLYTSGCTTTFIGRIFQKEHATIIHAIKMLHELQEVRDRDALDICANFELELNKPKANTNSTMSKLFFTEISYAGGMRKVEADIWPTMTETFRHSIVAEENLEKLKANLEELVERRAAELKVKAVPVTLSPAWDKLKEATLPRFLSVGRINVTLTEVRHVIGKDNEEAAV